MKKKHEVLLERIKKYIIENGPVTSGQIHDWYVENYGPKFAPTRTSIASVLRMHGKKIGIFGERKYKSGVYTWRGE